MVAPAGESAASRAHSVTEFPAAIARQLDHVIAHVAAAVQCGLALARSAACLLLVFCAFAEWLQLAEGH